MFDRRPILSAFIIALSFIFSGIQFMASAQDVITDFDGNQYKTVRIGEQIWMAENLRSIHDAGGMKIKRVCYELIKENCDKYGGLYSWNDLKVDIAKDSTQGICPDGWHIPDDEEWTTLINAVGGADSAAINLNKGAFKEFNVQYGGNYHYRLKNYNYIDEIAYYWTSASYSRSAAWMRMIGKKNVNTNRSTVPKVYCLSVRCIKD